MNSQESLVSALEERFGLRNLRSDWIRRQATFSIDVVAGTISRTDISAISHGTLPWKLDEGHSIQLETKVLVQIDDVINIASADPRSKDAPRVLQMTLTDGCADFVGVELDSFGGRISMLTVPGTKLVLHRTALVRRGRLLLTAKDFTLLGAPAANIWGDSYDTKVSEALSAARLHNPNASVFDSIARSHARSGTSTAVTPAILDMGGIADAIPPTEGNDDDDEEFWAQAAAYADRSEAEASGPPQPLQPLQPAVPRARALSACSPPTLPGVPVENIAEQNGIADVDLCMADTAATEPREIEGGIIVVSDGAGDRFGESVETPEMPAGESGPAGMDFHMHEADEESRRTPLASSVRAATEASLPALPLDRICDYDSNESEDKPFHLFRAFAMKPKKRPRLGQNGKGFTLPMPFDDGSSVATFQIPQATLSKRFELAIPPPEVMQPPLSASEETNTSDGISQVIRRYSRSVHGFIHVRREHGVGVVTGFSDAPPGNIVSAISPTGLTDLLFPLPAPLTFYKFALRYGVLNIVCLTTGRARFSLPTRTTLRRDWPTFS